MDEGEPILPVVPVLAYANPLAAQPTYGRLMVEHHENGVAVIDPKSAATSPVLLRWVGAVTMFLAVMSVVMNVLALIKHEGDYSHLWAAVSATICGAVVFWRSSKQKQEPRIVRVERGRVCTKGCPGHDWLSGRFRPRRFIVVDGSIDLKTRRRVASVLVKYGYGTKFLLIPNLSHDEAVWTVALLKRALDGNIETPENKSEELELQIYTDEHR